MDISVLRSASLVASVFSIVTGGVGMAMSFLFLSSASMGDIVAGTSGFVAGAVLTGSGLIALSMLSRSEQSGQRADFTPTNVNQ